MRRAGVDGSCVDTQRQEVEGVGKMEVEDKKEKLSLLLPPTFMLLLLLFSCFYSFSVDFKMTLPKCKRQERLPFWFGIEQHLRDPFCLFFWLISGHSHQS